MQSGVQVKPQWVLPYQRRFTQDLVPLDQVPHCHVEVGAYTAPVSDAVEWVRSENVLGQDKSVGDQQRSGPHPHLWNIPASQATTVSLHKFHMFVGSLFTLVLGLMRVTPCLLMAILTMSGKLGSDVCWTVKKRRVRMLNVWMEKQLPCSAGFPSDWRHSLI